MGIADCGAGAGDQSARDDPLEPPSTTESGENSTSRSDEPAVPVCLKCLTPYDPLQHYCGHCGEAVGLLTPYIPFVNIAFNYSIFRTMWRQIWFERSTGIGKRLVYLLLIIVIAPIMLIGIPFALISKLRGAHTDGMEHRSPGN